MRAAGVAYNERIVAAIELVAAKRDREGSGRLRLGIQA